MRSELGPIDLPPLTHLVALSDDVGIIQHAAENIPKRWTGYCTDDVARAFMVALAYLRLHPRDEMALRLASTYLAFLCDAQREDGRFRNFMSYARTWLEEVGSEDSCGRAVWALGYGLRYAPDERWKRVCADALLRALPVLGGLGALRARAFAALGLVHALRSDAHAADGLAAALGACIAPLQAAHARIATENWNWFEPVLTYDNARLPQALLAAGGVLGQAASIEIGRATLRFYREVTMADGLFVPIGNLGWYPRGGARARFAQQPLEAAAMVEAQLAAFEVDGSAVHLSAAGLAYAWFLGRNSLGLPLVREGACFDGLEENGVNRNAGAESTLAYLASGYALALVDEGRSGRIEAV
ncbi:MAG: hypothetical protein ACYDGW_00125 [Vulcanimicrobiaceae bacterium]